MEEDNTNNTPNDVGQEGDFETKRREQEAAAEVEVNRPDTILNETEDDEGHDRQDESNAPGDNLTDQHPTQDQTAGESGVSGRDDEAYDDDESAETQR